MKSITEENNRPRSGFTGAILFVNEEAVMKRINRLLKRQNLVLKKTRGVFACLNLGTHHLRDVSSKVVVDTWIDVEKLGRKVGVLSPWERLAKTEP